MEQLTEEHENLSTFVRALEETGLGETIASEGRTYTVFAPTDEAFEQHGDMEELMRPENREQLIELLRDHMIADEVDAERAGQLGEALTVSGKTLQLEERNGELTVSGAQVEDTDLRAGGLIVHTVDQVLEPSGAGAAAAAAGAQRQGAQGQASSQQGQSQAGQRQAAQQPGQAGQQPGQAGQGERPSFEEVDQNSDGQISRAELARVEGLDFSEVDTNQDGNISRQEYMSASQR